MGKPTGPLSWSSLCPSDDPALAITIARRSLKRPGYTRQAIDEIASRLRQSGWAPSSICDEVMTIFRAIEVEQSRLLKRPAPPPLERVGWAWPDDDRPRRGPRAGSWWAP